MYFNSLGRVLCTGPMILSISSSCLQLPFNFTPCTLLIVKGDGLIHRAYLEYSSLLCNNNRKSSLSAMYIQSWCPSLPHQCGTYSLPTGDMHRSSSLSYTCAEIWARGISWTKLLLISYALVLSTTKGIWN